MFVKQVIQACWKSENQINAKNKIKEKSCEIPPREHSGNEFPGALYMHIHFLKNGAELFTQYYNEVISVNSTV